MNGICSEKRRHYKYAWDSMRIDEKISEVKGLSGCQDFIFFFFFLVKLHLAQPPKPARRGFICCKVGNSTPLERTFNPEEMSLHAYFPEVGSVGLLRSQRFLPGLQVDIPTKTPDCRSQFSGRFFSSKSVPPQVCRTTLGLIAFFPKRL